MGIMEALKMPNQFIQVSLFVPCIEWMDYTTEYRQDSDSKYYDDKAASYFVELHKKDDQVLALSRTRIEFNHEHYVYADSDYLKSLGSEDEIYQKYLHKTRQCLNQSMLN